MDCAQGLYGYNFYLKASRTGADYFFTHLRTRLVKSGPPVNLVRVGKKVGTLADWVSASRRYCTRIKGRIYRGELVALSGIGDTVPHLHIALKHRRFTDADPVPVLTRIVRCKEQRILAPCGG